MNRALTVAKLNLRQTKAAYFVTGLAFLLVLVSYVTNLCVPGSSGNVIVSASNVLCLLPLLAAILVPARNLRRVVNLGAKRKDFLRGSIIVYAVLAASVSLSMLIFKYTADEFALGYIRGVINIIDVFGFTAHGPVVAFIQMSAFLLLVSAFAHTLTIAQDTWYGWLTDVAIVVVISVFTPIASLRAVEARFFNLVIFGNPLLQVVSCLALTAIIYALSESALDRKKI